jgi:tetratricopeptide (TPR) repeat protein
MRRTLILLGLLACSLATRDGGTPLLAADALIGDRDLAAVEAGLALPSRPAGKSLEELMINARGIRKAAMFVGRAEGSDVRFGTAFVISRAHRLLATNAHVADLMREPGSLRAILDGSNHAYRVERRWYHPELRRRTRDRSSIVRSQDPNDGEVALPCSDVAVLRLAEGGPELPDEVTLASWGELLDLPAQPVGVVGFPAYNYTRWPGPGNKVVATIQQGIVNRLSDYKLEADGPPESLQLVQHSIETWFGFSGAPVFLANGHVAAIIAGTRAPIKEQELVIRIPIAIRVDCLWELLAYHKLEGRVRVDDRGRRPTARRQGDDPQAEKFRRAVQLVAEAEQLAWGKSHREAIADCDEAIKLAPNYAAAYKWGAEARWFLCSDATRALDAGEQSRLMRESLDYIRIAVNLTRSLDDLIELVGMNNYYCGLTGSRQGYRDSLDVLKKVLAMPNLSRQQRGRALQSRAAVRWALGERAAIDDYTEALRNLPDDPFIYEDRATFYEQTDQVDLAARDRRKAQDLRALKSKAPSR